MKVARAFQPEICPVRLAAWRLLLRGVGPGLAQFGVGGVLARPTLTLFAQATATDPARVLRTNTGWTTGGTGYDLVSTAARASASPLPAGSADCAMVVTLDPGAYTLQIAGMDGSSGEALAEIYVLR